MTRKKVAIATLFGDSRSSAYYADSLAGTFAQAVARPDAPQIGLIKIVNSANMPRNRNLAAAMALANGFDELVFIDSDIAWNPDDLFSLIARDEEVVGIAPQKRNNRWNAPGDVAVRFKGCEIPGFIPDGLLEVEGAATAFLKIKCSVFRKLIEAGIAKPYIYGQASEAVNKELHNWFFYELTPADALGSPHLMQDDGEDYYFCRKWREIGGKVYVDPMRGLRHYEGNVCHDLELATWLLAQGATFENPVLEKQRLEAMNGA